MKSPQKFAASGGLFFVAVLRGFIPHIVHHATVIDGYRAGCRLVHPAFAVAADCYFIAVGIAQADGAVVAFELRWDVGVAVAAGRLKPCCAAGNFGTGI